MNSKVIPFLAACGLLIPALIPALPAAEQTKGAAEMVLSGGSRGAVPFPHRRHQETAKDCAVCHALFPQEKGIIDKLKEDGRLRKKTVMNKLCTKCHRERKRNGEKSGPTVCKECHSG